MKLEDHASYLQELKQNAALDLNNPKQKLLSELTDTVSLLCHQISTISEITDGMNEALSVVEEQLDALCGMDDEPEDGLGVDDYFDDSEHPLYEVKCPECGDTFAVDEDSLVKGFKCPTCGQHLIQA